MDAAHGWNSLEEIHRPTLSLESELVPVVQEMNNAHGRQDDVSESNDLY